MEKSISLLLQKKQLLSILNCSFSPKMKKTENTKTATIIICSVFLFSVKEELEKLLELSQWIENERQTILDTVLYTTDELVSTFQSTLIKFLGQADLIVITVRLMHLFFLSFVIFYCQFNKCKV